MATEVLVNKFTFKSQIDRNTIFVSIYGDGTFIRENKYDTTNYDVSKAENSLLFEAENFGVLDALNTKIYKKRKSTDTPQSISNLPQVKSYTITGRISNKDTQEPLEGINVSITTNIPNEEGIDERLLYTTKSDKQGNYSLNLDIKVEEIAPDVFSVLETPDLTFDGGSDYGIEKRKPYVGDNNSKTIKTNLDIVQMGSFTKDLKKEISKVQNVADEAIEKVSNTLKTPYKSLQKSVMKKIQDIIKKFIPLIIAMIAKFGISKLTEALQNGFSDFNSKNCPSPNELKSIIRKRNRIVKILNTIYKFTDSLVKATGVVLSLVQIFKLVKGVVVSLPIPQAIGTPPAKDFGGLIAAQPMSATLKNADNLNKFDSYIKKYEGLTIMILAVLTVLRAVLKMAIDLLKGLDGMIQTCAQEYLNKEEITLEEIDAELLAALEEREEETPLDPFINGFQISVVTDNKTPVGQLKRRYAVAKNSQGIILLKGEPSFSASDQILIEELKFYIQTNDLKAF